MPQPNSGIEARLQLVKVNRSAVYVTLCRAASGGRLVSDAVVVVADTSDDVGLELARAARAKAGTNIHEDSQQLQRAGQIPTAIIVVSLVDAKVLFAVSHPNIAGGLAKEPPLGCVRVVSIAAGAAMLVHSDVRPIASIAEA